MLDLLRERRSVRKYQSTHLSAGLLELLKEGLLRSPSSHNLNPWEFVFVDDLEMLEKLSLAKPHGSAFLKDAPLGIVVCGDETISDVWIEDCSIASVTVQYMALSLGLGSCWIQIRERMHAETQSAEAYVQQLLKLPEKIRVLSIIAIGYADEDNPPFFPEQLAYHKIHAARFTENQT